MEHAAALEAEAKAVRETARAVDRQIADEVRETIGPANPFTETYEFQADEATDAELVALKNQQQVIERLLAARNGSDSGLAGTDCGYWGDMTLMFRPPTMSRGSQFSGSGWTRVDSPDWFNELFPNWNEPVEEGTP